MVFHLSRISKMCVFFGFFTVLLLGRLFFLQLIEGPKLTLESLSSRVQEVPVDIARGEILDRNQVPLTNTAQHFSIVIFPDQLKSSAQIAQQLAAISGKDEMKIMSLLQSNQRPFKLKTDLDAVTAQKINHLKLPGVLAVAEKVRYGFTSLGAHIVGYTNMADNKGVSGLEAMYDDVLRGSQPEYVAAMVDATQQLIPGLGYKKLRIGEGTGPSHVVLTIDTRIQKIVEAIMDKQIEKGAVVVMRPSTGEILAMASRPNFDANNLDSYLTSSTAPLMNRALAAYQPGSVFKLVLAAAALENKVVKPQDVFFDPGYVDVNNIRIKGWDFEKGPRGKISFTDAIAYSSNPVIINVGLKLGAEELITYAKRLGFGTRTKLHFDGEADGNLPAAEALYPGDLANLSIGQGFLEATPLQVASLIGTIVNDGIKVGPSLVSRFVTPEGTVIKNFPLSRGARVLDKQTAVQLRAMMTAVTQYGTGQEAYVEKGGSAGKTGSAETGHFDKSGKSLSHAWFAGYAPLDNPAYVIVVFVEDGMSGGDVAAPIFREIAEAVLAIN